DVAMGCRMQRVRGGYGGFPAGNFTQSRSHPLNGARGSAQITLGSPGHTPFKFTVVSPEFPPPDGGQAGFNGDYSGLTINRGDEAHPLWSDTRNSNPFPLNGVSHDEDIFTTKVELP